LKERKMKLLKYWWPPVVVYAINWILQLTGGYGWYLTDEIMHLVGGMAITVSLFWSMPEIRKDHYLLLPCVPMVFAVFWEFHEYALDTLDVGDTLCDLALGFLGACMVSIFFYRKDAK